MDGANLGVAVVALLITVLGQFLMLGFFAGSIRRSVQVLDEQARRFEQAQHAQSQALSKLTTAVELNTERIQNHARLLTGREE